MKRFLNPRVFGRSWGINDPNMWTNLQTAYPLDLGDDTLVTPPFGKGEYDAPGEPDEE